MAPTYSYRPATPRRSPFSACDVGTNQASPPHASRPLPSVNRIISFQLDTGSIDSIRANVDSLFSSILINGSAQAFSA